MGTKTIRTRASPERVQAFLDRLPAYLTGATPDRYGIGKKFWEGVVYDLLMEVRAAFIQKSRGGADISGYRWKPLADSTIERRLAERGPFNNADKARLRLFLQSLGGRQVKLAATMKRLTRERKAQRYRAKGGTGVEILRDTGVMLNSISPPAPGVVPIGGLYKARPGRIEVGSKVPYFPPHQEGGGPGKTRPPQRRIFWDRIPAQVWQGLLRKANTRLARLTAETVERL